MDRTTSEHIEIAPGLCGGRAHIASHRIRVQDIVLWHEREGFSVDEIVARFPQLALADVYAALAYYHDHRDTIDQQMRGDASLVEAVGAKHPSKLAQKLMNRGADGDSSSSG